MERDVALACAIAEMVAETQSSPRPVIVQYLKDVVERAKGRGDGLRDEDLEAIERAVLVIDDKARRRTLFARTQPARH